MSQLRGRTLPKDAETKRENRLKLYARLEEILAPGFTGDIHLHCLVGDVPKFDVKETHRVHDDRRMEERRTAPRLGDDRRQGSGLDTEGPKS